MTRGDWGLGISKVFRTGGSYEANLKPIQAYKQNSHARWVLVCGPPWYLQRALLELGQWPLTHVLKMTEAALWKREGRDC